jgi:hypothetical protein
MKGIILDGVAAAGKSTVLQHLQTRIVQEKAGTTKLFISEHYTQRVLEDKLHSGQLDASTLAEHIDALIRGLGEYHRMLKSSKFAANPSRAEAYITIERFLLTYFATLPDILESYTLARTKSQFEQLASFGIVHYLLILSPEKIRENVAKTLTHRNEHWAAHIESKGGLEKAIEEYIIWQSKLLDFTKTFENQMRTEVIELKDQSYEEIADRIYEKEYR